MFDLAMTVESQYWTMNKLAGGILTDRLSSFAVRVLELVAGGVSGGRGTLAAC